MNRKAPRNIPFFDYSSLPSPVGRAGLIVGVNPLAVGQPSFYMVSTGTYWKPFNNEVIIGVIPETTPFTGSTNETIMGQLLLPAGFLLVGDILFIEGGGNKSGTTETFTLRGRMGTAGTVADATLWNITTGTATSITLGFRRNQYINNATTTTSLGGANGNDPLTSTSTTPPSIVTIANVSNPLYFTVTAKLNGAGADSLNTFKHYISLRRH